ncbi:hypothetical protein J1614_000517 [Plenodomus biglobosus]|nr:hypothetical protein J1614_000517 [Plenodomus biglobosus]
MAATQAEAKKDAEHTLNQIYECEETIAALTSCKNSYFILIPQFPEHYAGTWPERRGWLLREVENVRKKLDGAIDLFNLLEKKDVKAFAALEYPGWDPLKDSDGLKEVLRKASEKTFESLKKAIYELKDDLEKATTVPIQE